MPTNLHTHTHDWQLNCEAAVTFLVYWGDKEHVLFLTADSRFPLFNAILQPFSWLLINIDPNKPMNWQKTYRWAITKLWNHHDYFWATRRIEVYGSGPHTADLKFLARISMHGHKKWSTVMQTAHKIWKNIPMTDDPAVEPA